MAPLDYVALRLVRHYLPDRVVRGLLRRGLIIRAGIETSAPAAAIRRFMDAIEAAGEGVAGRRILIFGYGGRFEVATQLLSAGASHVVLVDPYAPPIQSPTTAALTIVHAPLREYISANGELVDIVLSNSVIEHVEDVASAVADLAGVTAPGGHHFHFIDLRDHLFKYPFEMLCYAETTWRKFLNPGSNLNRLRVWDYERLFSAAFPRVSIEVRYSDLPAFRAARARIRPEFLSGDEQRDAVTQILLRASRV